MRLTGLPLASSTSRFGSFRSLCVIPMACMVSMPAAKSRTSGSISEAGKLEGLGAARCDRAGAGGHVSRQQTCEQAR